MPDYDRERLRAIKTFPSLVKYLRDELDWPIEVDNFEDLTFEWNPEELGIDPASAAKIEEIKQLRPLLTNQPWGIFFVKFAPKRLPIVVLRRILSQLVIKKRASARKSEQASWQLNDLLFISNYGEGDERQITFAHFTQDQHAGQLPTLRVLGWDDADTALHIDHVHQELKEKLRWPDEEGDLQGWRERWSSAFVLRPREVITTSKELAVRLADLARRIRRRAKLVLAIETERGSLRKLHKAFKEILIHDLGEDDFADMYAQTITYGLLCARVSLPKGVAVESLPSLVFTNSLLQELLGTFLTIGGRKSKLDFDEFGIQEVVDLLNSSNTHMDAILRDFSNPNRQEDPVIHFYEGFLKEYDPKQRIQRGIFFTPRPVVSYIVRSVHELLQKEFGLEDGLASTATWADMIKKFPKLQLPKDVKLGDPFIQILDPATGTGTFLFECIEVIEQTMKDKWCCELGKENWRDPEILSRWNDYVPHNLLPRLYGYEIMMAPYSIAHLKLALKLSETGYQFKEKDRLHIYLTNSLEPPSDIANRQLADLFETLAKEAQEVNEIKRHKRFTVVIGNPPYAGWSANLTPETRAIVECYKFIDGERIREKGALQFEKNLQDDYVKFFAWSEKTATLTGVGILAFISNNGFLETPTLRGMRWHLLNSFSELYLLDLHGSTKRPIENDQNVFDIQQGVAISIFVKQPSVRPQPLVHRTDLLGNRQRKYAYLTNEGVRTTTWTAITPLSPLFQFLPLDSDLQAEYNQYLLLSEVMPFYSTGTETGFDSLLVDFTKEELLAKIRRFLDHRKTDADIEAEFSIGEGTARKLLDIRREFRFDFNSSGSRYCISGMYRVFDSRIYYYKKEYLKTNSFKVMRNLLETKNLALVAFRQQSQDGFQHIFVTKELGDKNAVSLRTREINYYFPMRIVPKVDVLGMQIIPSLNYGAEFLKRLTEGFGATPSRSSDSLPSGLTPEDIFHYIYAVFHSPCYRRRYAEFLKTDFPRLPLTSSLDLFRTLARLGGELVALHLLESPKLDKPPTQFVGSRDQEVEKVSWSDKTVWIDKTQTSGFQGVPEAVWNFHIGGYQVCEKWLKDRKGRALSKNDIEHYHRIIVALHETIRLMAEIDKVITQHGGWPGAFATTSQDSTAKEATESRVHQGRKRTPAQADLQQPNLFG